MRQIFLKILAALMFITIAAIGAILVYATLHDYRPPAVEPLTCSGVAAESSLHDTISLMTWNLGYGGLGATMDFFYDGGQRVRPEEGYFKECQQKILEFLKANNGLDLILLQEVDSCARRSYFSQQKGMIKSSLPGYCTLFAMNYDVKYVPVPLGRPMGKVVSGIMTLARSSPSSASRISLPGSFSWPKRLFMLDRCLLASRFPVHGNKELVVINIHNSAFDVKGKIRRKELAKIKGVVMEEYGKGNYVVAGGDWNTNPPGFKPDRIQSDSVFEISHGMDSSFLPPGWKWVFDPAVPTNRDVSTPYHQGITGTTLIDFFLVSPNIQLLEVKTPHLQFEASDHHPVFILLVLKH